MFVTQFYKIDAICAGINNLCFFIIKTVFEFVKNIIFLLLWVIFCYIAFALYLASFHWEENKHTQNLSQFAYISQLRSSQEIWLHEHRRFSFNSRENKSIKQNNGNVNKQNEILYFVRLSAVTWENERANAHPLCFSEN